jgi:uncharacterized protein YndB with AHSA1/START domain
MNMKANDRSDRRIIIERTYAASIDEIWNLWTTKEGIESWWGPGGFSVRVHKLDLRAGGEMLYAMSAVDPAQVAFMKSVGMPLTTEARLTYTEIVAGKRLAYTHLADFIPGVKPYNVATVLELYPAKEGVRMVLNLEPMHSEEWTQRAVMGMESQLEKLAKIFA